MISFHRITRQGGAAGHRVGPLITLLRSRFSLPVALAAALTALFLLDAVSHAQKKDPAPRVSRANFEQAFGKWEDFRVALKKNPELNQLTDQHGRTPLHYAAINFPPSDIEFLVANGIPLDATDKSGNTAIHEAAAAGSITSVKTLIKLGADPKALRKRPFLDLPAGSSVIAVAAESGHADVVKLLLELDVPVTYGSGRLAGTALHQAVRGVVDYRREKNLDRTEFIPIWKSNADVIDLLAAKCGNINIRNGRGRTPLHMAASAGAIENIRHLVKSYPELSINCIDDNADTPLHLAVGPSPFDPVPSSRMSVVRVLLKNGANPDLKNNDGLTPFDIARREGDPSIIRQFGFVPVEAKRP